jgi:uncharacterized protein (DUF2235 family)
MPRKLILCFDGTNDKYSADNTNVVKLYAMLERTQGDQLTYYQPGIGTLIPQGVFGRFQRWAVTFIDSAIAWLLQEHVTDGYRFLMRYYQPGDEIFIFGFSRGAYTARVVAGMLHKVGLLSAGNEELLPFAWDMYKRGRDRAISDGFRQTFSREVSVKFLGLWDTVSSIGWAWNPKHLPFTANNPNVEIVRHAVAVDERRVNFVQNLWAHQPTHGQDVLEVWFPGVHCDVGGGYPESEAGLSKIALKWMVEHARSAGLRFDQRAEATILPTQDTPGDVAPNTAGPTHESLRGLWWALEYLPKLIHDPAHGFEPRWIIHRGRHRYIAEGAHIHQSVFDRMNLVATYRPPNLPERCVKV